MAKRNRNVKDSLFCDLFGRDKDGKKNFLSLYNAIHSTNLTLENTRIEYKEIPQTIYKTFNNDVSMLINDKLIVMLEHQSTINENMPFRLLEYITRIYESLMENENRYAERRIMIPYPEFYVFYNGVEDYPTESTLKLSDAFIKSDDIVSQQDIPLELKVKVFNINGKETLNIIYSCDIMKQYCTFIDLIRKKATPGDEPSFKSVIEEAIENNILSDYLKRNSTEAINMLIAEYDYETDIKVKCREAREEGIEEGVRKGSEEASLKNAITIIKKYNLTVEEVARDLNVSVSKLQEKLNNN